MSQAADGHRMKGFDLMEWGGDQSGGL
jgi:hypothetical protein